MACEPYSPSGTYPTFPLTLVKDGEAYQYSSIMTGLFKPLIDAAAFANPAAAVNITGARHFTDITLDGTSRIKLASRSVKRQQKFVGQGASADWTFSSTSAPPAWLAATSNASVSSPLWFALDLPDGAVLTALSVRFRAASGHAALPTILPKVSLYINGVFQGSGPDNPALSVSAYQTEHAITFNCSFVVDAASNNYMATVNGEGGTNFVANGAFFGLEATYTMTSMPEF